MVVYKPELTRKVVIMPVQILIIVVVNWMRMLIWVTGNVREMEEGTPTV
ncbi:hypothetical protein [Bacteroides sp. OM05-12]